MTDSLLEKLESAVAQGKRTDFEVPTGYFGDPQDFVAFEFPPQLVDSLAAEVRALPSALPLESGFVIGPGYSHTSSMRLVLRWLLRRAALASPADAARAIRGFHTDRQYECISAWLLVGLGIPHSVDCGDGIALMRIEDLAVRAPGIGRLVELVNESLDEYEPKVRSALVVINRAKAHFATHPEGIPPSATLPTGHDLLDLLTVMTENPVSATVVGRAFQFEPDTPLASAFLNQRVRPDVRATDRAPNGVFDAKDFPLLVAKYRALQPDFRDSLSLPLRRLNLGLRRADATDKAIELGICLESMLLHDRAPGEPLSHLVQQRGACLMQERGEGRVAYAKRLRAAYDLRSQAVHSGKLKSHEVKLGDFRMPVDAFLDDIAIECSKMLRKLLHLGAWPNWEELVYY